MRFLWKISGVHDLHVFIVILYPLVKMEQTVLCTEYMLQYGLFSCTGDREEGCKGRKYRNPAGIPDTGAARIQKQIQKVWELWI